MQEAYLFQVSYDSDHETEDHDHWKYRQQREYGEASRHNPDLSTSVDNNGHSLKNNPKDKRHTIRYGNRDHDRLQHKGFGT